MEQVSAVATAAPERGRFGSNGTGCDESRKWRSEVTQLLLQVAVTVWWRAASMRDACRALRAGRDTRGSRLEDCQVSVRVGDLSAGCGMKDHIAREGAHRGRIESFLIGRALDDLAWKVAERLRMKSRKWTRPGSARPPVSLTDTAGDGLDSLREGTTQVPIPSDVSLRWMAASAEDADQHCPVGRRTRWTRAEACDVQVRLGDLALDGQMFAHLGRDEAERRGVESFVIRHALYGLLTRKVQPRLAGN